MAEEPPDDGAPGADAPKRKPPPPRVRIRASEGGAKVVEPPAEPPAAPAPVERAKAPTAPALPKKAVPPLTAGAVALESDREAPPVGETATGPELPSRKPPPPHVTRGPRGGAPAPGEPTAAAPVTSQPPVDAAKPATPVKVSSRPAKARSRAGEGAPPAAPAPRGGDAAPAARDGGVAIRPRPHIGTDEGRLSALSAAMWLLLLVLAVEVYAGFASNSLALFSDASHTFTDFFAYAIAAAAVVISQRKSSARETFGWHRAEVIAAFVSGILLIAVVVRIYSEAASRLGASEPVDLTYMLTVPWLPVAANLYLARRMAGAQDVNIEGARLHAVSDLLSSMGVIAAGVLIAATGNPIFDPLVSFFIGFLILGAAFRLLRESADILLEKSPHKIDVHHVVDRMKEVEGVEDVHAVHVWSLCSTVHALSAHVVTRPARDAQRVLEATRAALERHFAVAYTTLQVEVEPCGAERHPTAVHTGAELAHGHA